MFYILFFCIESLKSSILRAHLNLDSTLQLLKSNHIWLVALRLVSTSQIEARLYGSGIPKNKIITIARVIVIVVVVIY